MNKEIKGKKYLAYALVVGLLGSMMVANSSLGEFLTNNSGDEALKSSNEYLLVSEEQTEESSNEEESVKDDILEEVVVHDEAVLEEVVEESKLEEKTESKTEVVKEAPKEEVKKEIKAEVAPVKKASTAQKVDLSPITTDQYVVKDNDTLFYISQRSKVSMDTLKSLNNIKGDTIFTGQVVTIKSTTASTTSNKTTNVAASRGEREEDLYWLSRIIHAEAQGEPYEGKVAVGNVILNRVKSNLFPNTIKGVVFDKQFGYTQFSPVIDGTIYNNPGAESIRAAQDALNGVRPIGDALYFLNPGKATNFWILENRVFYKTIGDHDFYH